jgi:2,3-bisphosphoglycerate-dependent phosphoglycerate mutase
VTSQLTLLRHGESLWNREDRFAGWADVDLTRGGEAEARQAGRLLAEAGLEFDVCFTSVLKRAAHSCGLVLEELGRPDLPVQRHWRLNERHYGTLEGERRSVSRERYGAEQVLAWRWSWDAVPPLLDPEDPRFPGNDERYAELGSDELPRGESLEDCSARLLPYWEKAIVPRLERGDRVLVIAHGSSSRALVKYLDGVSDEDIPDVRIPTGEPLVYEFDENMKPLGHRTLRAKPARVGRWLRRQWARKVWSATGDSSGIVLGNSRGPE